MPSLQPALRVQLGIRRGDDRAADAERCGEYAAGRQPFAGVQPPASDSRPELAGDLPGQRQVVPAIGKERELDSGARQVVFPFLREVDIQASPLNLYGRAS